MFVPFHPSICCYYMYIHTIVCIYHSSCMCMCRYTFVYIYIYPYLYNVTTSYKYKYIDTYIHMICVVFLCWNQKEHTSHQDHPSVIQPATPLATIQFAALMQCLQALRSLKDRICIDSKWIEDLHMFESWKKHHIHIL